MQEVKSWLKRLLFYICIRGVSTTERDKTECNCQIMIISKGTDLQNEIKLVP